MFSEVAEMARVAQRRGQFQQLLKAQVIWILNFTRPHAITYTNNIHGKISPFWLVNRSTEVNKHRFVNYSAHPSGYQLKAYSDILSSALNERPQPSPGPAIIKSSESPLAEVRKIPSSFSNSSRKQWTVCFPIVMSETLQVFMSNNPASFRWT